MQKIQASGKKQVTIYLAPALSKWLKMESAFTDKPVSTIIEEAVIIYQAEKGKTKI